MSLAMIAASLAACLPAAKLVARMVERRRHTFTVAGAFFVGCLVIPLVVWGLNASLGRAHGYCIPLLPALAAVAVCYALGEGVGRLACVSFGCCYGKPVDACPRVLRGLFAAVAFVFRGKTKKAAYEGDLEGVPLVPIQALTAVWFSAVCLLGLFLFLQGYYRMALAATVAATQVWRWLSEFFRADYRGGGRYSPYQAMALLAIGYAAAFAAWASPASAVADLAAATALLGNPLAILFLQVLWVTVFLYTGRSQVTSSTISFHVQHNSQLP
jgi:prolipoprotein diacylglyceryltransferase